MCKQTRGQDFGIILIYPAALVIISPRSCYGGETCKWKRLSHVLMLRLSTQSFGEIIYKMHPR